MNFQTSNFSEIGIPMTTSLEVARIFGKSHYNVLRQSAIGIYPMNSSGVQF